MYNKSNESQGKLTSILEQRYLQNGETTKGWITQLVERQHAWSGGRWLKSRSSQFVFVLVCTFFLTIYFYPKEVMIWVWTKIKKLCENKTWTVFACFKLPETTFWLPVNCLVWLSPNKTCCCFFVKQICTYRCMPQWRMIAITVQNCFSRRLGHLFCHLYSVYGNTMCVYIYCRRVDFGIWETTFQNLALE